MNQQLSPYIFPGLPEGKPKKYKETLGDKIVAITEMVCSYYGLKKANFLSGLKFREYADARKVVCYLSCEILKAEKSRVGIIIGRDHSSVIDAIKKAKHLIQTNNGFATDIYHLSSRLFNITENGK